MRLFGLVLLVMVSFTELAAEPMLISDENVPIILSSNALQCSDKVPGDGEFMQPRPGRIVIWEKNIFDRTLRIRGSSLFYATLPDSVMCFMLREQIKNVPLELIAKRQVYRETIGEYLRPEVKRTVINGEISIEIPVQVDGNNLILRSKDQSWLEENPTTDLAFPKISSFKALIFPQSASKPVGLFCAPRATGSLEYELGFSRLAGNYPYYNSNIDFVSHLFSSQEICEETRASLLKRFKAQDPENWGSIVDVSRKIETIHRHILDNRAKSACQEIQMETVSVMLDGLQYSAVLSSFPLRTLSLDSCGPQ